MNELGPEHRPVAESHTGSKTSSALESHSGGCSAEHGIRGRASRPPMAGATPPPDRNTRFIETTHGILSYAEMAPLLAERVLALEQRMAAGALALHPLDESLPLQIHSQL